MEQSKFVNTINMVNYIPKEWYVLETDIYATYQLFSTKGKNTNCFYACLYETVK